MITRLLLAFAAPVRAEAPSGVVIGVLYPLSGPVVVTKPFPRQVMTVIFL